MTKVKQSKLSLVMLAIFIATFMTSVETTIVSTALPTIISKLNGLALQSWVFAMYLLTTAVSTPIYGKLADRIGRKPIFVTGLIVFTLGSFLSGLASNMYLLILFRAIQGIGAGAVMPITFTIIADLFTYEKRANMLAFNNTAWGISALLGPLLGGYIIDQLNWHWIFFINVPLGLIVLTIILVFYRDKIEKKEKQPIDYQGIISLSITLVSLLLLFQFLGNRTINWFIVSISGVVFLLFLTHFYLVERRAKDPIIPLEMFKNQLFTIQIVTALLLSGIQMGFQTYFPIWLQSIYRVSASMAGWAVTPSSIFWLFSSFSVGFLIKRFAPKKITLPVIVVLFSCYTPLIFASTTFPIASFYLIAVLTGTGLGMVITMNTLISQHAVSQNNIGSASSMLTLGRTLGQTIMTGLFGLLFNASINHQLKSHPTITFSQMTNFIDSGNYRTLAGSQAISPFIQQILVEGMHVVFMTVLVLFVLVFILNLTDRQTKVIS